LNIDFIRGCSSDTLSEICWAKRFIEEERWYIFELEVFNIDDRLMIFLKPLVQHTAGQSHFWLGVAHTCDEMFDVVIESRIGKELSESLLQFLVIESVSIEVIEVRRVRQCGTIQQSQTNRECFSNFEVSSRFMLTIV